MKHLYLLGHPISHSKSPVMYNAFYQRIGLDWEYDLKDCATEKEAREFLGEQNFLAINITTPYKPLVFEYATEQSVTARLSGGANMLAKKNNELIAYNLDGEGCVSFLESQGVVFENKKVVVCGTGPTALAILYAASLAGPVHITVLSRTEEKSRAVVGRFVSALKDLSCDVQNVSCGSYDSSKTKINESDIIINATPLGMSPGDKAPFDTSLLHKEQTVFDVVYGHGTTHLIAAARKKECRTFDGSGMLVAQAVASAVIQLEINNISLPMTSQEIFSLMAHAAGFSFSKPL